MKHLNRKYIKYGAVLIAALLVLAVVLILTHKKPEKTPEVESGMTKDQENALDIAGILYAYGFDAETTAGVLGNIEMESGGIDYTSMEVYYSARDPYGVNGGHSYRANAQEAHRIGPVKQSLIDGGMMGYISNSRIMRGVAEHYRGGGYFGFSYAGMKELWDFCENYDIDHDGVPEGYVWWQIPEEGDEKTPSGGELQILFSIGRSELFAPEFEAYRSFCDTYRVNYEVVDNRIRFFTYAFDLLFELGKPLSQIMPFVQDLNAFDDPTGNLDQSTPWTSRDERFANALKWYDFLTQNADKIDIEYGRQLLTNAGLVPVQ